MGTIPSAPKRIRRPADLVRSREAPEVRKKALIQATMRSIAKYGFSGTTVDSICSEAQLSRGMINHHFETKEELLRQSYQELCDGWATKTQQLVIDQFSDPEDRLRAFVRVSLGRDLLKADYVQVWIGYWSVINKSPALKQLHRETYKQDYEIYEALFEQAAKKRKVKINPRIAALSLVSLIDGFWLEWGLDQKSFGAGEAEEACLDFLDRLLK